MSRFSRINTIWRKELTDILRDRRTVIAMVLVPIVLYPALMLGSLQAFELQQSRLQQESYRIGVAGAELARWLRRTIDTDPSRQAVDEPESLDDERRAQAGLPPATAPASSPATRPLNERERGRAEVRRNPPEYEIVVVPDVRAAVVQGLVHVGLDVSGPLPTAEGAQSIAVKLIYDQTDVRSDQYATPGLEAILQRASFRMMQQRLARLNLELSFVRPIELTSESIATPEKVGGSILGQVVPLILILMIFTGAIYPAIDLTAGERERGTLETLMVAPVPTVDLIAGKFIVVALIGLLSAVLNLISIGGTIYLGGLGDLLSRGNAVEFPLSSLPWILLVLVPLAIMFSALLLAVCSFARSFKEAQNYVMPVLVAALIPTVVGVLPGTRLEGPLLIMPVANIVVLTRELFMGHFNAEAILWVMLSSSIYAGAAVAVAARLFGQEAVLFADAGSLRTIFQRRFFKPALRPTAAAAFLLLAILYPLHYFLQRSFAESSWLAGNVKFLYATGLELLFLFVLVPLYAAQYTRVKLRTAFSWQPPPLTGWIAALCLGLSTWVLVLAWFPIQQQILPMPRAFEQVLAEKLGWLEHAPLLVVLVFMALVPAVCEEVFFRGYVLSGLRSGMGKFWAVLVVAVAFGIYHGTVFRLIPTAVLGAVLGLLVLRTGSLWPAIVVHLMHNGLSVLAGHSDGLLPVLQERGFDLKSGSAPPVVWTWTALALAVCGVIFALTSRPRRESPELLPEQRTSVLPASARTSAPVAANDAHS